MAEVQWEEAPLLGGPPSPTHSISPPVSPAKQERTPLNPTTPDDSNNTTMDDTYQSTLELQCHTEAAEHPSDSCVRYTDTDHPDAPCGRYNDNEHACGGLPPRDFPLVHSSSSYSSPAQTILDYQANNNDNSLRNNVSVDENKFPMNSSSNDSIKSYDADVRNQVSDAEPCSIGFIPRTSDVSVLISEQNSNNTSINGIRNCSSIRRNSKGLQGNVLDVISKGVSEENIIIVESSSQPKTCEDTMASEANQSTSDGTCLNACSQEPHNKVTFRIEGEEDDEEFDNRLGRDWFIEIQPAPLLDPRLVHSFPRIPSNNKASFLSTTSSTASMPFCRICHLPDGDGIESLISPCRCAGTMKFIHHGCLMKWLEVSSSRSRQVPACELCNYQFHRRTKFRIRQCQMPSCSRLDKILHCMFLVCLMVMMACAAVTVVCFKQNSNPRLHRENTELTNSEVVTLTCGVLFFVAFFVAMYVEVKATDTLYRLCTSFFYINQTMHIYEYDRKKDIMYSTSNATV